jgi:anti-sigma factor ChrR (cupin superfamily)
MTHLGDRLTEFVLGDLPAAELAELESHVAGCAACAAEVAEAGEDLASLAVTTEPVAPSGDVLARLDGSLSSFADRFAHMLDRVSELADMAQEKMRELLTTLDEATTWLPGPGDGISVAHVDGGPATAGAICGYVRIAAGDSFPVHKHLGHEKVLVVQGGFRDTDGSEHHTGDLVERAAGTSHGLTALDGPDLIYLVVVVDGVDIDDDVIGPDDPRI